MNGDAFQSTIMERTFVGGDNVNVYFDRGSFWEAVFGRFWYRGWVY